MWLSNRRNVLFGLVALGGCGFTPAFGPNAGASQFRNAVFVQAPVDRVEFELVRNLEQRLGQPTERVFDLKFDLSVLKNSVVVSAAQEFNRFNLVGTLTYSLTDTNGVLAAHGTAKTFTSYSATGSTLATDQSERDAENRLMVILADQVMTQLISASAG
ncbi:MAG: LPS assembly lipoprotein LptE [Planktomarina sp.]